MATPTRRGLGGWWWSGGVAALLVLAMTPRVGVAADSSFPEPEELAPAVRFWAATFTQYGQRDVVIHDRVQLGLVYDNTIYMNREVPAGQALVKVGKKLRK